MYPRKKSSSGTSSHQNPKRKIVRAAASKGERSGTMFELAKPMAPPVTPIEAKKVRIGSRKKLNRVRFKKFTRRIRLNPNEIPLVSKRSILNAERKSLILSCLTKITK